MDISQANSPGISPSASFYLQRREHQTFSSQLVGGHLLLPPRSPLPQSGPQYSRQTRGGASLHHAPLARG
eukprot:4267749-Heterocapsa_arctica.AAC.1